MLKFLRHLFLPHESNNHRARLLHPSSILTLIAIFFGFQVVITQISRSYPQILGYAATQISPEEVITLTNDQRQANGLQPVKMDPELNIAASQKAADMFARDYWAHVSPIGTQPWYFITNSGYSYRYAGENLARDFSSPQSVIQAWMDSPSHRDNLLNPKYQDIGLAVVDGKLGGRETTLVVQMFGTKLSAPSDISKSSSTTISVKAAESKVTTTAPVSPFDVSRAISIVLLAIFVLVLIIDLFHMHHHKIIRWTSSSLAHLLFMTFLLLTALIIGRGHIV